MMTVDVFLIMLVLLIGGSLTTRRFVARPHAASSRVAALTRSHFVDDPIARLSFGHRGRILKTRGFDERSNVKPQAFLILASALAFILGIVWAVAVVGMWIALRIIRKVRSLSTDRKVLRFGLIDLVDDVARELRGGRSVSAALTYAIMNTGEAMRRILAPVGESIMIGSIPSQAVGALASIHNNRDLHALATLLGAGERLGGVRPDALDGLAAMMRDRSAAGSDVQTQAAQARVSAMVLGLAPIVFCGLLVLGDGRSSAFLLHTPLGLGCGVLGLVLDGCGAIWMSTVVRRATA